MGGSFSAAVMKLRRRPAFWILVGIWVLLQLAFGYVIPYIVYQHPPSGTSAQDRSDLLNSLEPAGWLGNMIGGLPLFGAAFVLIAGGLVTGSEYGWDTVATSFIQRPGRLSVVAGAMLAMAVLMIIFLASALVVGAIASYIAADRLGASTAFPSAGEILRGIGAGFLVLAMWSLLGAALGVLFRGTAMAIGLGLVYLFVIASLIDGFAGSLHVLRTIDNYLPRANAGAIAAHFNGSKGSPGITTAVSPTHGTIVTLCYAVAFLVIIGVLIRSRDVA
jgi:hypothetical protein